MISRTALVAVVSLGCMAGGMAQQAAAPEPYLDADAYQIYRLVLPEGEAYGGTYGTLVIQQETVARLQGSEPFPMGPENCLYPEAATRFRDAISDYNRVNQKRWLLQRKFQLEKPYEIVNSDTLKIIFAGPSWKGFHERYPGSNGIMVMSAVGFNKERTRAIVYAGGACGSLCGTWDFHLLEKGDAGWKEVPGVSCHTVS